MSATITIKCDNPETAQKVLDFLEITLEEVKEDKGWKVDTHFDQDKHGRRTIKIDQE